MIRFGHCPVVVAADAFVDVVARPVARIFLSLSLSLLTTHGCESERTSHRRHHRRQREGKMLLLPEKKRSSFQLALLLSLSRLSGNEHSAVCSVNTN